jgi:hypothetical protein
VARFLLVVQLSQKVRRLPATPVHVVVI